LASTGIREIRAQDYHITEKLQEFNLLEKINQLVREIDGVGDESIDGVAGKETAGPDDPGRRAEVLR